MSRTYSAKYKPEDYQAKRENVETLKEKLLTLIHPQQSYIPYFIDMFPETNNDTMKRKIRNVMAGKTTCDDVVTMLEKIVEKLKPKKDK